MPTRNILYIVIAALAVSLGIVGYNLYEAKKEPKGLQINIGPNGLHVKDK
ncbi:MAG: hypothetical protein K2W78_00165 [Xanthobacteraceae bacterium]|nr:hypothetical protein [Xanthobacteraceae bacterium]